MPNGWSTCAGASSIRLGAIATYCCAALGCATRGYRCATPSTGRLERRGAARQTRARAVLSWPWRYHPVHPLHSCVKNHCRAGNGLGAAVVDTAAKDGRGIDRMIPLNDGTPDCDYDVDVEVMELAYVFRTSVETIPSRIPYLHVDAFALDDCKMKVGLLWRGGDLASPPGCAVRTTGSTRGASGNWLLRAPTRGNRIGASLKLQNDFAARCRRFADGEVMRALDLVVSIDSMPAHLAGALGVRTWTLLQKSADWRWMCGRDDNPWYHAFFRQQQAGDWQPVVAQVKRELRQRLLSRKLHLS